MRNAQEEGGARRLPVSESDLGAEKALNSLVVNVQMAVDVIRSGV